MADDRDLLLAYARRGDVTSLSALVVRHERWMRAFLRGFLPAAADAEDAFQDVWIKVIHSVQGYRGGSVKAYLALVMRSVALDRLRRREPCACLDEVREDGSSPLDEVPDGAPSPGEACERAATREDVIKATARLPLGPRQVLLMRLEGELTFREIAGIMHVPLGTVLTWMQAAVGRLRRELEVRG